MKVLIVGIGALGGTIAARAINAGVPVRLGLIHYFFHPSTSRHGGKCYIPNPFVVPSNRGRGIGRILMDALVAEAKQKQAAVIYWQTEEFNGPARRLYEKVAKRSPFIRYEIIL